MVIGYVERRRHGSTRVLPSRPDEDIVRRIIIPLFVIQVFPVVAHKYRSTLHLGEDEGSINFTPLRLDVFHTL